MTETREENFETLTQENIQAYLESEMEKFLTPEVEARVISALRLRDDGEEQAVKLEKALHTLSIVLYHKILLDLAIQGKCQMAFDDQQMYFSFIPVEAGWKEEVDANLPKMIEMIGAQRAQDEGDGKPDV